MILVAVSAIPPITHKEVTHQEEILYEGRHAGYKTSTSWEPITDSAMLVPRILSPTSLNILRLDGTSAQTYTQGIRYYDWRDTENINERQTTTVDYRATLINDLLACKMENNIIDCWEVPDEYINTTNALRSEYTTADENGIGGFTRISNKLTDPVITYVPQSGYAQGVINNKTRYSQSVSLKVYNPASGASLEKNIYDVLKEGTNPYQPAYTIHYRVVSDIRPNGCPIFAFQYNNGGTDQLKNVTEYIKGGSWSKIQVNAQGISGEYFDKLALNQAKEELNTRTALGILGSAMIMGAGKVGSIGSNMISSANEALHNEDIRSWNILNNGGHYSSDLDFLDRMSAQKSMGAALLKVGSMAAGMAGFAGAGMAATIGSYALSMQKLKNQENILNARCITATTPIVLNQSNFFNDTGANKFYYVFTSYNSEDMRNYDTFLTRYGYNVGKMTIRNRHLYSRLKFVYIKANEFHAISNSNYKYCVGRSIMEKVESQLQQGVRIWRKNPDAHDLLPDGNNQVNPIAYRSDE